jgi:uncharacterized protein (TIGR02117 family)
MTTLDKPTTYQRWRRRFVQALAGGFVFYCGFLLAGYIPVNRDFTPPSGDESVRIFIRSNEIHTDLVLPTNDTATQVDWRELFPPQHFRSDVRGARYVAIGWGNRAFFVDTPRWTDAKLSTALGAVFPSETVLHVEYLGDVVSGPYFRELRISRAQYQRLADFVRESTGETDEIGQGILATKSSYNYRDRFYVASGSYHAFNNCNQWTGRALKAAGVPTGIWTPLKSQVSCWLPEGQSEP